MGKKKEAVQIELNMIIEDNGEKEYNTGKYKGTFLSKGERDVLLYEEELEEGAVIRNFVTIQPHKVTIKRSGIISMNQQFILNQQTETNYQHPHGTFHMETRTDSVTYDKTDGAEQGKLKMSYTVKLNGMDERKHSFALTYKKEN